MAKYTIYRSVYRHLKVLHHTKEEKEFSQLVFFYLLFYHCILFIAKLIPQPVILHLELNYQISNWISIGYSNNATVHKTINEKNAEICISETQKGHDIIK